MERISVTILAISLSTLMIVMFAHPMLVASQSSDYNTLLNTVIQDVQKAESAGAKSEEINALLMKLDSVVALQEELQSLPPTETDKRAQLSAQISTMLSSIDTQAIQLAATAAQRTQMDHTIAYASGLVAAVIGTVVYYYGNLFWRKYRVKRTFRMRIIPKAA